MSVHLREKILAGEVEISSVEFSITPDGYMKKIRVDGVEFVIENMSLQEDGSLKGNKLLNSLSLDELAEQYPELVEAIESEDCYDIVKALWD